MHQYRQMCLTVIRTRGTKTWTEELTPNLALDWYQVGHTNPLWHQMAIHHSDFARFFKGRKCCWGRAACAQSHSATALHAARLCAYHFSCTLLPVHTPTKSLPATKLTVTTIAGNCSWTISREIVSKLHPGNCLTVQPEECLQLVAAAADDPASFPCSLGSRASNIKLLPMCLTLGSCAQGDGWMYCFLLGPTHGVLFQMLGQKSRSSPVGLASSRLWHGWCGPDYNAESETGTRKNSILLHWLSLIGSLIGQQPFPIRRTPCLAQLGCLPHYKEAFTSMRSMAIFHHVLSMVISHHAQSLPYTDLSIQHGQPQYLVRS